MKHSKVGALMTADVVRAEYGTPFQEVARRLAEHRISGLPVVDDDEKVLGVISETDVMARQAETRAPSSRDGCSAGRAGRRDRALAEPRHKPGRPDSSCPVRPSRSTVTRPWSRRPASWHSTASNGCRSSTTRSGSSASSPAAICSGCSCADAEIREAIRNEVLGRALWLPPDAVDVDVREGVVTLTGQLEQRVETTSAGHPPGTRGAAGDEPHRPTWSRHLRGTAGGGRQRAHRPMIVNSGKGGDYREFEQIGTWATTVARDLAVPEG
jgi:hypothetical protein